MNQTFHMQTNTWIRSCEILHPTIMYNILGPKSFSGPYTYDEITGDGIQLKMYGKSESRPLRKLGHVNVSKTDSHKDPIMRAECLNVSVRPA